jgi:hypothetical protein
MGGIQDKIISLDLEKVKEIQLLETGDLLLKLLSYNQCCGARAKRRGAEIKLPPEAGAEIKNFGSGSFLFTHKLEEML